VMEPDAPKETGVAKYQRALRLLKHEVIVLFRSKIRRLHAQLPSHAEMESNPIATGKFEQHLFSPGFRPQKTAPSELADDGAQIGSAKNSLLAVELDPLDFLSESGIPLSTKIFDLCQFGHGWNCMSQLRTVLGSMRWRKSLSSAADARD